MSHTEKQVSAGELEKTRGRELERTRSRSVFAPNVDIKETGDELIVYADIPGVPEDRIDITVENGVLTLRGEVPETVEPEKYAPVLEEYDQGDYERAFTLSNEVDRENIRATLTNVVLVIHVPKAGPAKSRKIQVSSG
jgi:HSP20 family protein